MISSPYPAIRHLLWIPLGLLACLPLGCGKEEGEKEEEAAAAVKCEKAHPERLGAWTELPGTTQPLPNHAARVTAAVAGRVQSVLPSAGTGQAVAEGAFVREGQVIVQLDDPILRANHLKAQAAVRQAEADKEAAASGVKVAQTDRDSVKELQRRQQDNTGQGGPLLVGEVAVKKAELQLDDAQAKFKSAQARLASAQDDVKALEAQIKLLALRAPIAGRLGIIQVVPGQTLAVGTTVADVVDLDEIDVLCFAPPSTVARLALNQPALIVPANEHAADRQAERQGEGEPEGAKLAEGKVVFIAVQADPQTGSFPVKVRFPNKDLHSRANAVVQVRIQTQPEQERLVIPDTALIEDQEPPGVVVVEEVKVEGQEDKKETVARKLQAVIGVRSREKGLVEIRALKDSEEDPKKKKPVPALKDALFVIEGGNGLETGDKVKLEEEEHKEEHKEQK